MLPSGHTNCAQNRFIQQVSHGRRRACLRGLSYLMSAVWQPAPCHGSWLDVARSLQRSGVGWVLGDPTRTDLRQSAVRSHFRLNDQYRNLHGTYVTAT